MPTLTRRRRGGPRFPVDRHTIGNADVVFPKERLTSAARSLALALPADPDNDVVVVDLPVDTPIAAWESVAEVLPRRRRGVRLVLGGRARETTALAGQWLSERLRRTVVAPDGAMVHGAAGALFVHSGRGSGWVRFHPGRAPEWEAKRFPRPAWDAEAVKSFPTSSTGVADPIPGGVWIRPVTGDVRPHPHWSRLAGEMPCQPDVLTVVLGCPGTPPLPLDDVVRFWCSLSGPVRAQVRFVPYGPVRLPADEALGQVLADVLNEPVRCYLGLPLGAPASPDVYTVRATGEFGWRAFAGELAYLPRTHPDFSGVPTLLSPRAPIEGPPELAPAVYWYAPDAAIEVVQSGLWVRPHEDLHDAAAVRARHWDPDVHLVVFDDTDEHRAPRMRMLAQDALDRLDPATRDRSRLVASAELTAPAARQTGRAAGALDTGPEPADAVEAADAPAVGTVEDAPALGEPAVAFTPVTVEAADVPAVAVSTVEDAPVLGEPAPTAALTPVAVEAADAVAVSTVEDAPALGEPAPTIALTPVTVAAGGADDAGAAAGPGSIAAALAGDPAPVVAAPPPADDSAAARLRLESSPAEPAPEPAATPTDPAPASPTPTPERASVSSAPARTQPAPAPEAAALLSDTGLERERAWLRRTLSREFDTMANSTARILSEHPGFQNSGSSGDLLTDTVAVRLYLTARGVDVDLALRTAAPGPHVPLARCVVAGLSRLPSHRGGSVFAASPTPAQWRLYEQRRVVTEWGFTHALVAPGAGQGGEVDVLVWSMTGRRTRLLEPDGDERADGRVVFVPGTSFKVLELAAPGEGTRGRLFLRELAPSEIDEQGRVDGDRASLDELAMGSLRRCAEHWAGGEPAGRIGSAALSRFGALPGLA
jgi:hypothetical protein